MPAPDDIDVWVEDDDSWNMTTQCSEDDDGGGSRRSLGGISEASWPEQSVEMDDGSLGRPPPLPSLLLAAPLGLVRALVCGLAPRGLRATVVCGSAPSLTPRALQRPSRVISPHDADATTDASNAAARHTPDDAKPMPPSRAWPRAPSRRRPSSQQPPTDPELLPSPKPRRCGDRRGRHAADADTDGNAAGVVEETAEIAAEAEANARGAGRRYRHRPWSSRGTLLVAARELVAAVRSTPSAAGLPTPLAVAPDADAPTAEAQLPRTASSGGPLRAGCAHLRSFHRRSASRQPAHEEPARESRRMWCTRQTRPWVRRQRRWMRRRSGG